MGTRLPAIPDISNSAIPLEVKRAIMALAARSVIREAEGPRSDPLDRVMTFRDAQTLSLVEKSGSGFVASAAPAISAAVEIVEAAGGGADLDLTMPPEVDNLAVIGGYSTAFVTFDQPSYTKSGSSESNHAYTEIYRADANGDGSSPGFASAIAVAQTQGAFVPDAIGGFGQKYFYWARNFSRADVPGPVAGGATGVSVTMPVQVDVYMDALDAATGPFVTYAVPTVVNGQTLPAGTYMRNAFIQYGVIGSLHVDLVTANRLFATDGTFGTVVADTVKVLNANIAGTIQSDTYVAGASGWKIDKAGDAEFNDVAVRGTLYGGAATAFGAGVGLFAGDVSGTYKFRLGDPNGSKVEWDGTTLSGSFDQILTFYGETTYTPFALTDMRLETPQIGASPVWTTDAGDTWSEHSATGLDTGVWAGVAGDVWATRTTSAASSWESVTYPLSRVVISEFRVTYDVDNLSGTATVKLRTKQASGDAWTEHTLSGSGADTVKTSARYVSLLIETTGVMQVIGYPTLNIQAEATEEVFDITTSAAGAITVDLGGEYGQIAEVRFMPAAGSSPVVWRHDNEVTGTGVTNSIDFRTWNPATGALVADSGRLYVRAI